jgi:hypothetical protein
MQHKITVLCDRCHKRIEGIHDPETGMTGGFYRVGGDPKKNQWAQYRNGGENVLCDRCMHHDKRYQAVYGTAASKAVPIR